MERLICLDGVAIRLEVDHLEVDLAPAGLHPADHADGDHVHVCDHGVPWQALMSYHDGTTLYVHGASPAGAPAGYKVACPRPHRWVIVVAEEPTGRVARLGWEAAAIAESG